MLTQKVPTGDIGVVVGRFQVHQLHKGHTDLLNAVCDRHDKVIVFIGTVAGQPTKRNPMDFATRREMIRREYSDVIIEPIRDCASDVEWSSTLDRRVRELYTFGKPILYGSRDSFISHYKGAFTTCEFEPESYETGTDIRAIVQSKVLASSDFRAGVIYANANRFPTAYPTVDVAVLNREGTKMLLGRKHGQTKFQFIGGFVDPTDASFEAAVKREFTEEASGYVEFVEYLGSRKINDWRYAGDTDGIVTTFFKAIHTDGAIQPADDIEELKWFDVNRITEQCVRENHLPLMDILMRKIGANYYDPTKNMETNYAS